MSILASSLHPLPAPWSELCWSVRVVQGQPLRIQQAQTTRLSSMCAGVPYASLVRSPCLADGRPLDKRELSEFDCEEVRERSRDAGSPSLSCAQQFTGWSDGQQVHTPTCVPVPCAPPATPDREPPLSKCSSPRSIHCTQWLQQQRSIPRSAVLRFVRR